MSDDGTMERPWREATVLAALDVTQKQLREWRRTHLTEGQHYGRDARGYWFTQDALDRLRDLLTPPEARPADPPMLHRLKMLATGGLRELMPARTAAPVTTKPLPEDTAEVRITRTWASREKMVLGDLPDGREVVVAVQNSAKLMPGMVLKGCRKGVFKEWVYTGPLPKRRGVF